MRRSAASGSAQLVAMLRALASKAGRLPGFSDPTARAMLSARWSWWLARLERGEGGSYQWMADTADRVAVRTRFLDEAIAAAAPGVGQFVNLGAGLDGRASAA